MWDMARARVSFDKNGKIIGSVSIYDADTVLKAVATVLSREEFPLIEDVAMECGVTYRTILNWRKDHEELDEALGGIEAKARIYLQKGAVTGNTNVIGSIFLLKANHGLKDNPDQDKDTKVSFNVINYKDAPHVESALTTEAKSNLLALEAESDEDSSDHDQPAIEDVHPEKPSE